MRAEKGAERTTNAIIRRPERDRSTGGAAWGGSSVATGETKHRDRRVRRTARKPCGTPCGAQARSGATAAPHKGGTQGMRGEQAEGTTVGN